MKSMAMSKKSKMYILQIHFTPNDDGYKVVGNNKEKLHKYAQKYLKDYWTLDKYSLIPDTTVPSYREKFCVMKRHLKDDMQVYRIFDKEAQIKSEVFLYYTVTEIKQIT